MKTLLTAVLATIIMGISCTDKDPNGSQTAAEQYMSLTPGNTWTYQTVNSINSTTASNTVTSANKDTLINGKTYHVFTNSGGAANDYYNITGNDYYTFRNLVALGSSSVEHIYLKDNATAGTSWSQIITIAPFSGVPTTLPLTVTNTITEKNLSRTVNGKTYANVIHVTTSLTAASLPAGSLTTDIHTYYAPKYGMIESKYKITTTLLTGSNVDQITTLKTTNF